MTEQAPPQQDANVDGNGTGRGKTLIAFPYGPLKDAEQIAQELHERWGGETSPEQLAGGLGQTPKSGAFRNKTGSARVFGLVQTGHRKISLTPLGQQIVDPATQAAARVEAFLTVPLFAKLYEEFKTSNLPPERGLEQKILGFGVPPKQTAKARQVFQRSAEQAGFFKAQPGRLVKPPTNLPSSDRLETRENRSGTMNSSTATAPLPAPVLASVQTLLQEGGSWPADKTHEFVKAMRQLNNVLAPKQSE